MVVMPLVGGLMDYFTVWLYRQCLSRCPVFSVVVLCVNYSVLMSLNLATRTLGNSVEGALLAVGLFYFQSNVSG